MYLSRLCISNYRSIKNLDIKFSPGKNILVGKNNAGKSNVIRAINLVLGENSPDYKNNENLTPDDFFTSKEENAKQVIIWCELTRGENEQLDYQELYGSCSGYRVYCDNYGYREKRCSIESIEDDIPELFKKDQTDGSKWIDAKDVINGTLENQLEPMHHFAYAFIARLNGSDVEKSLRFFYREDDSRDWIMSFYSPFRKELIQSALVPCFRDPQNQLRINSWSWYGKLLKSITKDSAHDAELNEAIDKVKNVADLIFSDVGSKVTSSSIKTTFPGTTLHFQFNTETKTDLYKSCVIYVDDGFKSQLTEKGAGIQSAIIVGLFSYYMREINTIGSALLCIEEPELYLHPHGRRVMNTNLDRFLDDDRNQVIIATHSADFINSPSDANVILVKKNDCATTANSVNIKDIKHILINNDQNELFFADKVILCEGYDNYILRWVSESLFPGKLDENNVSVISVGGKDFFKDICKQLMRLQIECYILADFDFLLRDKAVERLEYNAQCHDSLLSLTSHYFSKEYIFGAQGNQVFRRVEKCRNAIKQSYPKLFYQAIIINEIPRGPIRDEILEILTILREHGVCVLSGQIEDVYVPDESKKNHFDLDKIYEIKRRIDEGASPSDLFNASELEVFLRYVLNEPDKDDLFFSDASLEDYSDDESFSGADLSFDDDTPF